jgi:hypothetical protein
MAGDWIKMRGALLDHPKVIAISRSLHCSKQFRDWLTPGGGGEGNGQILSDSALRCVTTALLMRVWSVAREHGKFSGDDLVLEHSELVDIDQMAGAPGVGQAMQSVRWAIVRRGVILPNFKEFNVPMTAAEKQREYRIRHGKGNGAVTETLPSEGNEKAKNVTSRVEKRRTKTPLPPSGAFERFWTAYPRKKSRGRAEQAWRAIKPDEQLAERIIAAVERAKTSADWQREGGRFMPYPASWLNAKGWEDEVTLQVNAPFYSRDGVM